MKDEITYDDLSLTFNEGYIRGVESERQRAQVLIDLLETIKPRFYTQIEAALKQYRGK